MNPGYKLGLRAIKTAISVFFCLLIALIFNRTDTLFASIAAIICLQPTYNKTFSSGLQRLVGTLVGGVVGYLIILTIYKLPFREVTTLFIAPFSILMVIYICNVINQPASVSISCIVVLSVVMWPDGNISTAFMYVVNRMLDTSMGIIVAMLVNRFTFTKRSKSRENQSRELDINRHNC